MAKSKPKYTNDDFRGFIEYSLDEVEKKQWREFFKNTDEANSAVLKAIEAGYRLTSAYDDYNQCYQCSMSTRDEESLNYGYIMVGRGDDWYTAMVMVVFKHFRIMAGDWTKYRRAKTRDWE